MPALGAADTIRILVATDSHVGYGERDPIRKDDSWKSFDEVMRLAKSEDVDMVLLAGDLFHDNRPSRKAMYQVMRSVRQNCLGEKPCELEMLSDASEVFDGAFNHVNYEDPDINVAIPVFSIHGNHDDPTGDGQYCSLDLLQVSGLVNYFGRTPESDNIKVKPVLLQKGQTKLALYGMSNVRDERLFRTFSEGNVTFFQPARQKSDWFNLLAVHQNHHKYSDKNYLPENFLPEFMDLVVWGHEHECLIDPRLNPEMGFHVMQPGSSVATSLVPGEAVPKHVAIVSVTGKEFTTKLHRITSVRPFVTKELILREDNRFLKLAKKKENKQAITRLLMDEVEQLIVQAKEEWLEIQEDANEDDETPLPLIRLRVEYTAPSEGGNFDVENPQRFSNRFVGKVANVNDVVQFYRKKAPIKKLKDVGLEDVPEALGEITIDNVKVEKLVQEFLQAQSLKILPQAPFTDSVSQFVDKDDKHAMELFVNDSLAGQVQQMLELDLARTEDKEQVDLEKAMESYRAAQEELFAQGALKRRTNKTRKLKPRPDHWDSDMDGSWADQPGVLILSDREDGNASRVGGDSDDDDFAFSKPAKGKAGPASKKAAPKKAPAAKTTAAAKKATASATRGRPKKQDTFEIDSDEEEEEDQDVIMLDDSDEAMPPPPKKRGRPAATPAAKPKPAPKARAPAAKPAARTAPARAATRQTQLTFSQPSQATQRGNGATQRSGELSDDVISDDDDDDAFEPVAKVSARGRR